MENWKIFSLIDKSGIPHFLYRYTVVITNWVVARTTANNFWQLSDYVLEWFSTLSFESLTAEKPLNVPNGPGSNNPLDFT